MPESNLGVSHNRNLNEHVDVPVQDGDESSRAIAIVANESSGTGDRHDPDVANPTFVLLIEFD
jgi:hypothetical protein